MDNHKTTGVYMSNNLLPIDVNIHDNITLHLNCRIRMPLSLERSDHHDISVLKWKIRKIPLFVG